LPPPNCSAGDSRSTPTASLPSHSAKPNRL
jgi:hypothetical protein